MNRLILNIPVLCVLNGCGVHPEQSVASRTLHVPPGAKAVSIQGEEAATMIAVLRAAPIGADSLGSELSARSIDCAPETSDRPTSCLVRRDGQPRVRNTTSTLATPLYDVLKAHGGLVQGAFVPTEDAAADHVVCSTDELASCSFTVGLRHY